MTPEQKDAAMYMAQDFYQSMPGAPPVPIDSVRGYLWGEVEGTEHWAFCETIARRIVSWSGRAIVKPD
jgi:hypothetical protein